MAAKSQNEIGAPGRGRSGHRYRKAKNEADRAVRVALSRCRIPAATGFRRLVVTRFYSRRCRPFDEANCVGGAKPLVDALVQQGVLIDDKVKFCKIWYWQKQDPSGKLDYVEILVEEPMDSVE